jgi:hypothetical protein
MFELDWYCVQRNHSSVVQIYMLCKSKTGLLNLHLHYLTSQISGRLYTSLILWIVAGGYYCAMCIVWCVYSIVCYPYNSQNCFHWIVASKYELEKQKTTNMHTSKRVMAVCMFKKRRQNNTANTDNQYVHDAGVITFAMKLKRFLQTWKMTSG